MYSVGDRCPTCGEGTLILAKPSSKAQFVCNHCHATHANAYGTGSGSARLSKTRTASGEKVRGKPKKEITHGTKLESQVRYIKLRDNADTKVIQIAYDANGRVKHLNCKVCGNKWYLANNPDYRGMFELTAKRLRCKKCDARVPLS
jgi:transcription elongation factor Elf1